MAADPAEVVVTRQGQTLSIVPAGDLEELGVLRTTRHRFDRADGGRVVAGARWLIEGDVGAAGERVVRCLAGLEPIVLRLLRQAGRTVRRAGAGPRPLSEPVRELPRGLGPADAALLDFVRRAERGLIRTGAVDPARLVAQLALAYPDRQIAVVAARQRDVAGLAVRLRRWVPGVAWGTVRSKPARPARVIVSTFLQLVDGVAVDWGRAGRRHLVIALDALEALGDIPLRCLQHADGARLFGLLGRDVRPAPHDADGLAELFGLDELVIPRHGYRTRPVTILAARVEGGPALDPGPDPLGLKRRGLWRHPVRNRRVARLAAALARRDQAGLAAELPAARGLPDLPGGEVVVLVEGLDHAKALAERLPGWPVVAGGDVAEPDAAGVPAAGRIATLAGLERLDAARVGIVLRADGGLGLPRALEALADVPAAVEGALLLVDLDDRHHPELRRRARSRRAAYAERGWAGDGDPLERALDRFLANRPEAQP